MMLRICVFSSLVFLCNLPLQAQDVFENMDAAVNVQQSSDEKQDVDCTDGGGTTYDMVVCGASELELAEAKMDQYWQVARSRFVGDDLMTEYDNDAEDDIAEATAKFDFAQESWHKYRESHCGSLYHKYRGGTIRGPLSIRCHIDMVEKRTWQIWNIWLTYMDTTPPMLAEPDFGYYPDRDYKPN